MIYLFLQFPIFVLLSVLAFRVLIPIASKGRWYEYAVTPFVLIIWVYDVLFNVTIGSVIFLQLPFEFDVVRARRALTFSDRLQALVELPVATWRVTRAVKFAKFVNKIAPYHILLR